MKVVVLGFDGLEPTLVEKLQSQGRLPTFERLAEAGVASTLDSTVIPISAMAWSSFLTGTNPGKHGVFDFVTRSTPDSDEFELTTSDTRRAPAFWDYLNALDYRVGVVGVPVTYPVEEFDGFMISGYPTPGRDRSFSPPSLADSAPVDPYETNPHVHFDGTNREAFLEDQFRSMAALREFHEHAMADLEWDVLVSVFKQTDDIAHVAWDSPQLHEAYERADAILAETERRLEAMDEEYLLLVLSDHGFGPVDKTLFLNNVLRELGYVRLRDRHGTRFRDTLNRRGIGLLNAYRVASALGLGESVMSVGYDEDTLEARVLYALRNALLLGSHDIDTATSACFSRGNYGQIFVEDESLVDDIVEDLLAYTVDGEPIIEAVHRATDHFEGEAVDLAPDLMIQTPDYRYLTARGFALATDEVLTDHVIGRDAEHKQTGVFYATGAGVEAGHGIAEPSLEDFLPTVLHALGEPIPTFLDGEVLELGGEAVEPTYRDYGLGSGGGGSDLSDAEERALREQLESLGYAN